MSNGTSPAAAGCSPPLPPGRWARAARPGEHGLVPGAQRQGGIPGVSCDVAPLITKFKHLRDSLLGHCSGAINKKRLIPVHQSTRNASIGCSMRYSCLSPRLHAILLPSSVHTGNAPACSSPPSPSLAPFRWSSSPPPRSTVPPHSQPQSPREGFVSNTWLASSPCCLSCPLPLPLPRAPSPFTHCTACPALRSTAHLHPWAAPPATVALA